MWICTLYMELDLPQSHIGNRQHVWLVSVLDQKKQLWNFRNIRRRHSRIRSWNMQHDCAELFFHLKIWRSITFLSQLEHHPCGKKWCLGHCRCVILEHNILNQHQGSFFWLQNMEGEPLVGVFATNHQPPTTGSPSVFCSQKKEPWPALGGYLGLPQHAANEKNKK
jgi:hypothetical protein